MTNQNPDPGNAGRAPEHKPNKPQSPDHGGQNNGQHRSLADKILDHAMNWLGVNYVYGGNSKAGIDCSGLVQQVFGKAGITLPRIADQQARVGTTVSAANARPGDLVYFENNASEPGYDHIGIYIGHGKMIVAPHTGTNVQIQDVGTATGFDRVLPDSAYNGMQNKNGNYVWHPSNGQNLGADATMNATQSASTGNAADGGGPSPSQNVSRQDIKTGLNAMGFASKLIHSDPSLEHAFHEIINKEIDTTTGAGRARALNILQNTDWFQQHDAAQRQFDKLRYTDHSEWQAQIDKQRATLENEAGQMGLDLNDNDLDHLAHVATRNALNGDQISHLLGKQFDYKPGDAYSGEAGQSIDSIQQMADKYYVPISNQQIQHYTRQTLMGSLDPSTLADTFKEQALSLYPYLKQQLNAGQTVADIADPYKQLMANTLELSPGAIKQSDPSVLKALQSKDEQGELGLMPLWQFQNKLYDDPRWMKTQNAHESLVGTTGDILQKLGLIT